MSERYKSIYALPKSDIACSGPVAVEEGVLIGDRQTGEIFAQLKLGYQWSQLARVIREITLVMRPMNKMGQPLGDPVVYAKTGLALSPGEDVVVITPTIFPDRNTRAFSVTVSEVLFADGTRWVRPEEKICAPIQQKTVQEQKIPEQKAEVPAVPVETKNQPEEPKHVEAEAPQNVAEAVPSEAEKPKKQKKGRSVLMLLLLAAAALTVRFYVIPEMNYRDAIVLLGEEKYDEAIAAFQALDGYKDSDSKVALAEEQKILAQKKAEYDAAAELEAKKNYRMAAIAFGKLGDYEDARARSLALWEDIAVRKVTLSAGGYHTVALKTDGTVVVAGQNLDEWCKYIQNGQCEVKGWKEIISIAAGGYHTLGLKEDGTVVATGLNRDNQCEVSGWRNIIAVSGGDFHSVGLRADGTVVAVGNNDSGQCNVSTWKDIVAISAGSWGTLGLKMDGTVVATGTLATKTWTNIIAIEAGQNHAIGLTASGKVVTAGNTFEGTGVSGWTNIVAISAAWNSVGVKADGTVLAVGVNEDGQCNVQKWTDIVAVSGNSRHTVGLKSDGRVVAVGDNLAGRCNVTWWRDIQLP